ncbi:methyltransferase-like protein 23 [Marchantia polymorpha subsp. ruderalis]|uniref:Methyltransferase-like protein 23 n=2 Tax=Marchantia polymorpha TaxID=3197 RepID=A0AAF6BB43_MARPO|nr:hypothetical protein MARPO_0041s0084 [Marchantia polymorpha]BBN09227.1 hypothetical protein Mp_4g18030 [Marchantia polymorpha subsp. ruderalis]|eukprot:PTQ40215.1 hypothetical protein MARPO_0041s0084 [Marchantia polymorpha]
MIRRSPSLEMQKISEHEFADGPESLTVRISEVMKEDYGLYVWPSSILLAEYVWQQRTRFRGRKVLELGAGTALPGIVAAKVGADVVLTDHADLLEVFENMKISCALNKADCKIQGLTWGEWNADTCSLQKQVDIVLGADVIYQNTDFDDLFATVSFFFAGRPDAVFITTYEKRSGHRSVEYLMAKWGLSCSTIIDVSQFVPFKKIDDLPSSLQLIEIVPRS